MIHLMVHLIMILTFPLVLIKVAVATSENVPVVFSYSLIVICEQIKEKFEVANKYIIK